MWTQAGQILGMNTEDLGIGNENAISWSTPPELPAIPQQKNSQPEQQKSVSFFNRQKIIPQQKNPKKVARENFPPMTSTIPQQKNLPLPTNNFPGLGKIFTQTIPQQKIPQPAKTTAQKSTSIFSRRRQTSTQTTSNNLPPMTSTIPQQKKVVRENFPTTEMTKILPRNISSAGFLKNFSLPKFQNSDTMSQSFGGFGKIFSGIMKLPGKNLDSGFQENFDTNLGKLLSIDGGVSEKNHTEKVASETIPPINITITINGNADAETMRTAGNEIAINLRREMDDWWRDKSFEEERRSFV